MGQHFSVEHLQHDKRQAREQGSAPITKADECRRQIEIFQKDKWFGRTPTAIEKAEMVRRVGGDLSRVEYVFKEVVTEATTFGKFGATGPTLPPPPNDPTPAATGASSVDWFPPGLLTTLDVFPDEMQLRAIDAAGGPAAGTSPEDRQMMGLSDVGPATKTLVFDLTPKQTAGDVLTIDCVQAARTLGIQDFAKVAKAIVGAAKSRRKA